MLAATKTKKRNEEFYPIKTFEVCNYLADNAVQLCSDFYLLYDAVKNKGAKQFEFDLEMLTKQLDYAFQRYILYAVTREARHAMGDAFDNKDALSSIAVETDRIISELHLHPCIRNDPIEVAKVIFICIRNTKEDILNYLHDLEYLFGCGGWHTGYGDEPWRKITLLLIDRLTEPDINLYAFVDRVWHAQHNYYYFLDKLIRARRGMGVYRTLEDVLRAKFNGDYQELLSYTSYPQLKRYFRKTI